MVRLPRGLRVSPTVDFERLSSSSSSSLSLYFAPGPTRCLFPSSGNCGNDSSRNGRGRALGTVSEGFSADPKETMLNHM